MFAEEDLKDGQKSPVLCSTRHHAEPASWLAYPTSQHGIARASPPAIPVPIRRRADE